MWVFGYGSLLWYTDFPYERVVPGIVRGYSRRFWQLSPDHRGTPTQPGRTVTLVQDHDGSCWGLAYKIADKNANNTVEYLDEREKAGYIRTEVIFHPEDGSEQFKLNVYLASVKNNPYFTGPAEINEIVNTILNARGPSGSNLEYALRLANCLRRLAPHVDDDHLFEIERKVLDSCRKCGVKDSILHELGYITTFSSYHEDKLLSIKQGESEKERKKTEKN